MKPLTLDSARLQIRDADLLLWRHGADFFGRVIAACGRGDYSHAAMAAWNNGELHALEIRQFRGGREVLLGDQVREHPGRIDWYPIGRRWSGERWPKADPATPDLCFDRQAAVRTMRSFVGCRYGWWNIVRVGLRHLWAVRLLAGVPSDVDYDRAPPFCSQAVAIATRAGGVDPVPHLADRLTEPGDLARSLFYEYGGTLTA
jgi:hypothetical protein